MTFDSLIATEMDDVHYCPTASSIAQMLVDLFCYNQFPSLNREIDPFAAETYYYMLMIAGFVESTVDNRQIVPCCNWIHSPSFVEVVEES